ncbi:Hypothetical predicted protein [Octopus vulgaris]|uniref:Uncharacterized protein n=1 Tax=Octopus vulgaris TaxID=6645 RepID=A0AA36BX44_OCTVU|nr:Hypothetical predicted protein [Octopus vulgaris]
MGIVKLLSQDIILLLIFVSKHLFKSLRNNLSRLWHLLVSECIFFSFLFVIIIFILSNVSKSCLSLLSNTLNPADPGGKTTIEDSEKLTDRTRMHASTYIHCYLHNHKLNQTLINIQKTTYIYINTYYTYTVPSMPV